MTLHGVSTAAATPAGTSLGQAPAAQAQAGKVLSGKVQLTRRGRFLFRGLPVLMVFALLLVVASFALAGQQNQAQAAQQLNGVPSKEITVRAGDTLWDIAAASRSDQEVSVTMQQIQQLNNLGDGPLRPGQKLHVPTQ